MEKVENALEYNVFKHDRSEWDNVASIIPKFSFHLQKHLMALVYHCFEKSKEEST